MSILRSLPVPVTLAPAIVLPALSPVSSVYSPAPFLIFALDRLLFSAKDSSTKPREPAVLLIALATPSEPLTPVPPGAFQALALPNVQSDGADLLRYLVKLSTVPDSSERWIVAIAVLGSLAPLFWAAIAGSFHLVILPEKILASVGASSCRPSTPSTLYTTAIGPITIGMLSACPPAHLASALGCSSGFSAESEPPKSAVPAMNAWMPAPEPVPSYETLASEHWPWYVLIHSSMAFFCAVEPCAVRLPSAQFPAAAEASEPPAGVLLSEPHAVSASIAVKAMPAT